MYSYKKKSNLRFTLILVVLAVACFAGGYYGSKLYSSHFLNNKEKESPYPSDRLSITEHVAPTEPSEAMPTMFPEAEYKYFAKEYQGQIGIFDKTNNLIPQFIITVSVISLPITDREMLQKGIILQDDADLTRLIEDYTS